MSDYINCLRVINGIPAVNLTNKSDTYLNNLTKKMVLIHNINFLSKKCKMTINVNLLDCKTVSYLTTEYNSWIVRENIYNRHSTLL